MNKMYFEAVRYVAADSLYGATMKVHEFQRLTYQDAQDDIDTYYAELGYDPDEMHVYTVTVRAELAQAPTNDPA